MNKAGAVGLAATKVKVEQDHGTKDQGHRLSMQAAATRCWSLLLCGARAQNYTGDRVLESLKSYQNVTRRPELLW